MRALIYHDVTESERFHEIGFPGAVAAAYKLEPPAFEGHLDAIAAIRRVPGLVTVADPLPPVALTFDDGGASALRVATMLERRGWRGHFFITTSRIGSSGFLTASEVRELADRGHVVGSHSHTHPVYFGRLAEHVIADEWQRSRDILATLLGTPPDIAGVPGGDLSQAVVVTARDAGFRFLMTSEPTTRITVSGGLTVIGRYTIWSSTSQRRAASLAAGAPLAAGFAWLDWNAKKILKRAAPSTYQKARRALRGRRTR
jgi:peptidoglycan/xylan/chitin deacetylase (PgdA/CDA1 family)